jgi:dipeptidyl-peptidase-4
MKGKMFILILGLTLLFQHIPAQNRLTFEDVFIDNAETLLTPLPEILEWIDDGHYLEMRKDNVVKVSAISGSEFQLFCFDQYDLLKKEGLELSDLVHYTLDFEKTAYVKSGDLFLFLKARNKLIHLSIPSGDKQNPRFSPDGRYLAFTVSGNLSVYDIRRGKIQAATLDGTSEVLNGYASWVYYEEILGRDTEYRAFWWSPDSSRIVFMRFDQRGVPRFTMTGSDGDYGYQEKQFYPKSGYPNPGIKIGVLDVSGNIIDWIDLSCENDCYISFLEWEKGSGEFYFQKMNRDQNALSVLGYNVDTQKCDVIYKENQKHWIGLFFQEEMSLSEALKAAGIIFITWIGTERKSP